MTKDYKQKYKTTNWPEYNKALTNRGNLTIWFDSKMQWQAPLKGKRGKPPGLYKVLYSYLIWHGIRLTSQLSVEDKNR